MNCSHLGKRALVSRSLPRTQQGCAALNKIPAWERHTKKVSLLQRSRQPHTSAFHPRTRPRPAHSSGASRARLHLSSLLHFNSRATHARALLPAELAFVPFGFVLVRVLRFWPHVLREYTCPAVAMRLGVGFTKGASLLASKKGPRFQLH
jgi:hypothetical protein